MLFGGGSDVVHALGRKSNLTGRTDIWAAVIAAGPNPSFGAGFESFWISPLCKIIFARILRVRAGGTLKVSTKHTTAIWRFT